MPEPIPLDEITAPRIAVPTEPLEEFLLQKEHGPFMVLAYTFRGPEASKYAQILTAELRRDYHLPAYIWLVRIQPMRSNIHGVQPTAPDHARNNDMAPPERYRTYDEAAVLVGNCKTIDESEALLHTVKKIVPRCLGQFPQIYQNRKGKGLNRSIMTTNPFQAAQNLFPGAGVGIAADGKPVRQNAVIDPEVIITRLANSKKIDPLIVRMNGGPNSLFKNRSEYTLMVAEFTGRTSVAMTTQKGFSSNLPDDEESLKKSPLIRAHDEAEKLAEVLNKCHSLKGTKAYVFHGRVSSFVTVGGFNSKTDPNFRVVAANLNEVSNELMKRGFSQLPLRPSSEPMAVPKDH